MLVIICSFISSTELKPPLLLDLRFDAYVFKVRFLTLWRCLSLFWSKVKISLEFESNCTVGVGQIICWMSWILSIVNCILMLSNAKTSSFLSLLRSFNNSYSLLSILIICFNFAISYFADSYFCSSTEL